jgi:hypothetical protein
MACVGCEKRAETLFRPGAGVVDEMLEYYLSLLTNPAM